LPKTQLVIRETFASGDEKARQAALQQRMEAYLRLCLSQERRET
jgi:hypothetical protein